MSIVHGIAALLLVLPWVAPVTVQAAELSAKFSRISGGAATLENVRVDLVWPEGSAQGQLRIRAKGLEVPSISYRTGDVDWQCPLQSDGNQGWRCRGPASVDGASALTLAVSIAPAMVAADLRLGQSRLQFEAPAATPDLKRLRVEAIPIAWLKAFLGKLWQEGNWTQGSIAGQVDLVTPVKGPFQVAGDLKLESVGLETPDGWLAAAGLNGQLSMHYREQGSRQDVVTTLALTGGELLAQSLYVVLPATPVQVTLRAERLETGLWRVPEFSWRDGAVLQAAGSASLDASSAFSDLDMQLDINDLASARGRYLSGFLAPAGFADLTLNGAVRNTLHFRSGALSEFDVRLDKVNAIDSKGRFTFAGLDGNLRWTLDDQALESALNWESGAIYGIGLGTSHFPFSSRQGELQLSSPQSVAILGGHLSLDHFRWQPPSPEQSTRFALGATMVGLDMASLSQRLGWPAFTGTIGGKIPAARYQNNVLVLDGGLEISAFGGSVTMSDLEMERPFGIAPTLSANIVIEDIGLEAMTQAFDFGSIAGRMDGRIENLRLVDWSPAAFKARLFTDSQWDGKRRISQRAVADISEVAGSGILAGLQAKVLKIFDDFGYDKIGLGCELKENICRMDGVGSAGDGYIIVAGAGLPRIQVVGFRRQVDWPTLVSRLKAVTQGQAPVIQ